MPGASRHSVSIQPTRRGSWASRVILSSAISSMQMDLPGHGVRLVNKLRRLSIDSKKAFSRSSVLSELADELRVVKVPEKWCDGQKIRACGVSPQPLLVSVFPKWAVPGLNWGPSDFQAGILPGPTCTKTLECQGFYTDSIHFATPNIPRVFLQDNAVVRQVLR